jgi:2',3'-cyclic-nucleotide 2'-phosphodiesterase/3'-nucleotidase
MNKTIKFLFFSLLLIILFSFTPQKTKKHEGKVVVYIYATNDVHGHFFDSTYNGGVNESSLSKVSGFINKSRLNLGEQSVILLDIGDNLQGDNSVFYYNNIDTLSTNLVSEAFNFVKYDAVVVGNHDIEAGHRVYDKVKSELKAPYLAANAISTTTGCPYFQPYTIINKNGVKIAVIGFTNANIKRWLSSELYEGIDFLEIFPLIEKYIADIRRKESPDLVVAAMHAGLGKENYYQLEDPSEYIAAHVKGIDLIFAAHDHKTFAGYIKNEQDSVPVVEGGSKAQNLSLASVEMEFKRGKVVNKKITVSVIPLKDFKSDSLYNRYFSERFNNVKKFSNSVIGYIDKGFSSRDAFFGSSEYVDMIHSLQLENSKADISFAAPLSFDITINAGPVSFQSLTNIYPFENQLYVIKLSGKEIKNYLEYSYRLWVNKVISPKYPMLNIYTDENGVTRFRNMHFNFDSAAGIIYEVDVTKGYGERINIISMTDGTPFDLKKVYKVALSSYRASGGGDLLTLGAGIPTEQLNERVVMRMGDIRDMMYAKLKKEGKISPAKLNNWKFVPDSIVKERIIIERAKLFK